MIKFLLLSLLLSGCAYPSLSKHYEPVTVKPEKAMIYIYRTQTDADSANFDIPRFYVNGKEIGKLSLGGYYVVDVDPQDIEVYYKGSLFGIPFSWKDGSVYFKAEPGRQYFVKYSLEGPFRTIAFQLVPNAFGEKQIQSTRLLIYE